MAESGLRAEDVFRLLKTSWAGRTLYCLAEVDSTNLRLKEMGRAGAPHGCAVIADHQTAGRGRMARAWQEQPCEGLLMSVLARLGDVPPDQLPTLALVASLAITDAFLAHNVTAGIKWPNDLVWDGYKLCGMLLELGTDETGGRFAVVGIGINANGRPKGEGLHAASLSEAAGRPIDRAALAADVLSAFESRFDLWRAEGWAAFAADYTARSVTLGREILVIGAKERFEGRAVGLREDGALMVERVDGRVECVQAGDVSVRGVMGYA